MFHDNAALKLQAVAEANPRAGFSGHGDSTESLIESGVDSKNFESRRRYQWLPLVRKTRTINSFETQSGSRCVAA